MHASSKGRPKSCSCFHCKHGKHTGPGKSILKAGERAYRHATKIALNTGRTEMLPAPRADRPS